MAPWEVKASQSFWGWFPCHTAPQRGALTHHEVNHFLNFFFLISIPLSARCFGAEVSWDKSLCIGGTYEVTDETITHQIVDRPDMDKQYINR